MAKKDQVILNGQPVGRIKAGWILFKETWRFLMMDKEMLWIPVITGIMNGFFFCLLLTVVVVVTFGTGDAIPEDSPIWYVFLFCAYVVGAFTLAFSQAAITHIVFERAHGRDATLGEGLKRAFSHWFSLFVWSIIAGTVGLVLRFIAERSNLFAKFIAVLLGVGWSVLTYFVVPSMVIDSKTAFASIPKSGEVFKQTWGETLVSNISYGLVFFFVNVTVVLTLVGVAILGVVTEFVPLVILAVVLMFLWFILAGLVASTMSGVLKTLLYLFAIEGTVPNNFNRELIEKMLARNRPIPDSNSNNF